jgi:hypothetical protein
VTFVFPNHFFQSFSFVMLWDRFVQIRRGGGGGGVRIRIWQADVTTWLSFQDALHCAPKPFFLFFPSYSYFLLFLCTFVLAHCVCVCPFPLNETNAYLIATILTDMEQVVMNRISYSYNKKLIEQSWCDMRTSE